SDLESAATSFYDLIRNHIKTKGHQVQLLSKGSIFWFAFGESKEIGKASDLDSKSMDTFTVFYKQLLEQGIYFGPSGYEVGFVSSAHTESDLKQAARGICAALDLSLE
ncbi:MAG: aspartate aminotransferase family protein, partial [Flavobacteriales bacterium]|nr:aspartate aminotransferase family protein [Flavobacteriales bacterium]